MSHQGDSAKNFADIYYTASGLRAESWPLPLKRHIVAEWKSGLLNALHIFSQARIKILAPWKYVSLLLPGWMEWPRRTLGRCEVLTLLTASGRPDQSLRLAPMLGSGPTAETKPLYPMHAGGLWSHCHRTSLILRKEACDGCKQLETLAEIRTTLCRRHSLRLGLLGSLQCKWQQFLLWSCTPRAFDWTGHDCVSRANVLFLSFSLFWSPEQIMCISPVPVKTCMSHFRSKNMDGHSARIAEHGNWPTKLWTSCTQGICNKCLLEVLTQGMSSSDESENSTSHSTASTAPRVFASTYEKAAIPRQPPLWNNAVAPPAFNASLAQLPLKRMRSPLRGSFKFQMHCRCLQVSKAFCIRHMRE